MTQAHFGDRYQLIEPIAEGGMGTVWRARHVGLESTVALKILCAARAQDPDMRRRFLREARLGARARHPNIVQVHDVGETDGRPYVAMELVEGRPIHEWVEWENPTVGDFLWVVLQALAGLDAAHAAQVIHQDVKPENLLVARNTTGVVAKLIDFGISRDLNEESLTGGLSVVGTVRYMAPERLYGEPPDPRADLYSLGLVLYEGLTGRSPFEDESIGSLVRQIESGRRLPVRKVAPWVPADLAYVVERAIRVDPDRRFQTARDMGKALQKARRRLPPDVLSRRLRDPGEPGRGSLSPLTFSSSPPAERIRLWLATTAGFVLAVATALALWHGTAP